MGRFINADAFAATGQGLIGNNMFAYCGNNPIIYSDNNGNAFSFALKENRYAPLDGGRVGSLIGMSVSIGVGIELTDWLMELEKQIQEKMMLSLSKANTTNYKKDYEEHHVAARNAKNAALAAMILNEVLPDGVEDAHNKIWVSTDVHRRIHTNLYYSLVNKVIIFAYASANGDKQQQSANVIAALGSIKVFISTLDALSNINKGG